MYQTRNIKINKMRKKTTNMMRSMTMKSKIKRVRMKMVTRNITLMKILCRNQTPSNILIKRELIDK